MKVLRSHAKSMLSQYQSINDNETIPPQNKVDTIDITHPILDINFGAYKALHLYDNGWYDDKIVNICANFKYAELLSYRLSY